MKHWLPLILLIIGASNAPTLAHHSFVAEYDATRMVTLKGVVTQFDWMNPHSHCYIDVKDEKSRVTHWDLELGGPGILVQNGWSKETLRAGDSITAKAALARNGTRRASARIITLPDGQTMYAASPADGGPQLKP